MKKILMVVAAFCLHISAFSQEDPGTTPKTFSIGPAIGFGHTGIRNTEGTDIFKPSWSAGVIINYSSKSHIGFAADVLWSMEGGRVENNGIENDLTLHYIRVPLKLAYFFGDFEDDFRPKITLGPSMGFLIDADNDAEDTGSSDVTSFYSMFDLGVNASVGFNWKVATNIWLNTDFRYYTGFTTIRVNQYNSNFGVKLGIAFGL